MCSLLTCICTASVSSPYVLKPHFLCRCIKEERCIIPTCHEGEFNIFTGYCPHFRRSRRDKGKKWIQRATTFTPQTKQDFNRKLEMQTWRLKSDWYISDTPSHIQTHTYARLITSTKRTKCPFVDRPVTSDNLIRTNNYTDTGRK